MFRNDDNRRFFLDRFNRYLSPFLDTYSWCLLPNHFHFLIRTKANTEIKIHLNSTPKELLKPIEIDFINEAAVLNELFEIEWMRFFTSYSMAFNKMFNRKWNFFHRPFKRVLIQDEFHLRRAIVYIHSNPIKHNVYNDFENYKWSSYQSILSTKPTQLKRDLTLDLFGNKNEFIKIHREVSKNYVNCNIEI